MLRLAAQDFLVRKRPWSANLHDPSIDQLILMWEDKQAQEWEDYIHKNYHRRDTEQILGQTVYDKIDFLITGRRFYIEFVLKRLEFFLERDIFSKIVYVHQTLMHIILEMNANDVTKSGLRKMLQPYITLYLAMEFLQNEIFFVDRVGNSIHRKYPVKSTKRYQNGDYSRVHDALRSFKKVSDISKGTTAYDMTKLLLEAQKCVKELDIALQANNSAR